MDERTDERTDKRTDKRKISPLYRTLSPIGAAAQKAEISSLEVIVDAFKMILSTCLELSHLRCSQHPPDNFLCIKMVLYKGKLKVKY